MDDRTVLRLAHLASFELIAEFAYEIGYYWATPIGGVPVLLLGLNIFLFVDITLRLSANIT